MTVNSAPQRVSLYKSPVPWLIAGTAILLIASILYGWLTFYKQKVDSERQRGWTEIWNAEPADIAIDNNGIAWALFAGIIKPDPEARGVSAVTLPTELVDSSHDRAVTLAVDSRGNFWVGTLGSNLIASCNMTSACKIYKPENAGEDTVTIKIVIDGRDRVWIWHSDQLSMIDPAVNKGDSYILGNTGLTGNISGLIKDSDKRPWIIHENTIKLYNDRGNWIIFADSPLNKSNSVLGRAGFAVQKNGLVWVGGNGSIHVFSDMEWKTYSLGEDWMSAFDDIQIDPGGRVWAPDAFRGILRIYDYADPSQEWQSFEAFGRNPNGTVFDKNGIAWRGAYKFDLSRAVSITESDPYSLFKEYDPLNLFPEDVRLGTTYAYLSMLPVPVAVLGLALLWIAAFLLSKPNWVRGLAIGFIGWFFVFSLLWTIIGFLGSFVLKRESGLALLLCILPLPIMHIIAIVILFAKPRTRWIGAGVILAVAINIAGLLLFRADLFPDSSSIWSSLEILFSQPFFVPGME